MLLVEPLGNRTVNREAGTPEFGATWTSKQAIPYERKNLEFLAHLPSESLVDSISGPCEQLSVPNGAVIRGNCRDSAEDIVWPITVGQICRQTLPEWIVAATR